MNALATTSLGRVLSQCADGASGRGGGVVCAAAVMASKLVIPARVGKEKPASTVRGDLRTCGLVGAGLQGWT
ncbi:hypothetical protein Psi01_68390 [Planobispora siamensis]|uniref:Uncharacterized protein n=1 Tax=Planobispora siamensis TaxID=936338 RepID=A0A8J3SN00_9ACTN|nr:hypothetical protein Psi01_68390 [Planobispora siamensis]